MLEIFLPTIRWNAGIRGLLEHLRWMSREYDILISVSDDSENPEKHAFLDQVARGNPRFRVHMQRPRLGMFRNFAFLFRSATRPYGMLVSDDDWLAAEYVLGADRMLEADPELAAIMGLFAHLVPDKGAAFHAPVDIRSKNPAERIAQYLRENDSFNHPLYSVFRTDAVQPFCRYVEKHPLTASFFDFLIVFSFLARGGLTSRQTGPYVYRNTNWSSPERVRESNTRSYTQSGLPEWFADFHHLYRGIEGFNFLAGPLSPIADSVARRDAGLAVLTHHLGLFKRQAEAASTQWWEHARRLGIATNVELFRTSAQMMPAHVLDSFLGVLKTASPGLHERYIEFHDRMNRP